MRKLALILLRLCAPYRVHGAALLFTLILATRAYGLSTVPLTVRETAGVARANEVLENGIPLPRDLAVTSTSALSILDPAGNRVPAEFTVLARWHAAVSNAGAPIQWVLAVFPVSVPAHASVTYTLRISPEDPPSELLPLQRIQISQDGGGFTVNTGAAQFILGRSSSLFDSIRNVTGNQLAGGGALTAGVNGATASATFPESARVERLGALSAVIVIEGSYDAAPIGGGALTYQRRYRFHAGSPAARIRQTLKWEGDLCPQDGWDLSCDWNSDGQPEPNGVRIERLEDTLSISIGSPASVSIVSSFAGNTLSGSIGNGESARLEQRQRVARHAPASFAASLPGVQIEGTDADGGVMAASGSQGVIAAALNHMHRYEPQALELRENSVLALDPVSNHVWLGQRQGLFAEFAVAALPASANRENLNALLWAPLNHPLRAWPSAEWFSSSKAVDALPSGELPTQFSGYDSALRAVLAATVENVEQKGTSGMMTYGVFPRYWGNPLNGDELDCQGNDPTPAETWDDIYWCGTWTDYHNASALAVHRAMRGGEVEWLDEIAAPAALRTLYTQIIQCSDSDSYFYCGQAPAGYGGYRFDFNSSHAYFENLLLYYWLTGDTSVIEITARGASNMRDYLCSKRPAATCLATDPPTNEWAHLSGRVAMQWLETFRFIGLTYDPSFLDDYVSGLTRAATQYYVEGGAQHGIWLGAPYTSDGDYRSDQLWMASLYDMYLLRRLSIDTSDGEIGVPPVRPSRIVNSWARTLADFGARVLGDGTAAGVWPNELSFRFSGPRLSGEMGGMCAASEGSDPFLYDTGKAALAWVIAQASSELNDNNLADLARELAQQAIAASAADSSPLGKVQAEYLIRLSQAVALLSSDTPSVPTPTPTPQPGVSLHASDDDCGESQRNVCTFTISRGQNRTRNLKVRYRMNGKARNGSDYRRVSGVAKFRGMASTAVVTIIPIDDRKREGSEGIRLSIIRDGRRYRMGTPVSATATLRDNE